MALNDAVKMLNMIQTSSDFRGSLYVCNSPEELDQHLQEQGYKFTYDELDDGYRKLLLECQDKENADELTEAYNMYRLLIGMEPVFAP